MLTHGHEDHIGGLAYLLKKINCPVYGTKLTLGLVEGKLKEHNLLGKVSLNVVAPRQTIKLGCMAVEFIRVNHSTRTQWLWQFIHRQVLLYRQEILR